MTEKKLEELVTGIFEDAGSLSNFIPMLGSFDSFWTDTYKYKKAENTGANEGATMDKEAFIAQMKAAGSTDDDINKMLEGMNEFGAGKTNIVEKSPMFSIEELCGKLSIDVSDIYKKREKLEKNHKDASIDDIISIGLGIEKRVLSQMEEDELLGYYIKDTIASTKGYFLTFNLGEGNKTYRNIKSKWIAKQLNVKDKMLARICVYEYLNNKKSKVELPHWFTDAYIPALDFMKEHKTFEVNELKEHLGENQNYMYSVIDAAMRTGCLRRTKRGHYEALENKADEDKKELYSNISDEMGKLRLSFLEIVVEQVRQKIAISDVVKEQIKDKNIKENDIKYFLEKSLGAFKSGAGRDVISFSVMKQRIKEIDSYIKKSSRLVAEYYKGEKKSIREELDELTDNFLYSIRYR